MIRAVVEANPFRDGPDPFPAPVVIARDRGSLPPWISRLGADKATFLCEGIAGKDALKRGQILDLFAGSSVSTVALCRVVRGTDRVVSGDLRYAIGRDGWAYAREENFEAVAAACNARFATRPRFVALDAAKLPFADATFAAALMPDPPRDAAERFDRAENETERLSGGESGLDYASQRALFLAALGEARRCLRPGGVVCGTAPRSWTRLVETRAWSRWQVFSSERIDDDVTILSIGRRLRFRVEGALDPVVYFRGVK